MLSQISVEPVTIFDDNINQRSRVLILIAEAVLINVIWEMPT